MSALKLDLDRYFSGCAWGHWCERARHVLQAAIVTPTSVEVRRTRHGFHVIVEIEEVLSSMHVVALQAALGSDGVREAINANRARHMPGIDWNVLFERKTHHDGTVYRTTPNIPAARRLRNELRQVWPHVVVQSL